MRGGLVTRERSRRRVAVQQLSDVEHAPSRRETSSRLEDQFQDQDLGYRDVRGGPDRCSRGLTLRASTTEQAPPDAGSFLWDSEGRVLDRWAPVRGIGAARQQRHRRHQQMEIWPFKRLTREKSILSPKAALLT
ncbi:hypothetical protein GCM10022251_57260 [Phytohabitans flavus]|uniref:Uncharacterized protein n=1 Tax=Phytohabitans flavus TaxID=1076124 RepID=A0A6F8XTM9_9ACTN|nr:hypothetical protein Pflav_035950 [Phytohabitans flavus]